MLSVYSRSESRIKSIANSTPTLFVVDDDAAVRNALKLLLENEAFKVSLFESAEAFLATYAAEQSGCLLLDIKMPGMSGLQLQEILNDRHIDIPIIFMTGHGDVSMSVEAFRSGAVTFLEKPFKDSLLLDCVEEALAKDFETRRRSQGREIARSRYERLTPREKQVMTLILAGKSNKEIARQLGCSHRTIEVHRARILRKMETRSLPDLITLAVSNELPGVRTDLLAQARPNT